MHKFAVVTVHPQFILSYLSFGPLSRALQRNLISVDVTQLRDFAVDSHGSVDDRPYGGGEGMVLRPEPLQRAVESLEANPDKRYVVITSPGAKLFNQKDAQRFTSLSQAKKIIFISGRFSGIDQRFIERYADEEISLGTFILAGGELASLAMLDSTVRLIKGSLGSDESAQNETGSESFSGKREYPLYTRPEEFEGLKVPGELLSGNPLTIADWRRINLRDPVL